MNANKALDATTLAWVQRNAKEVKQRNKLAMEIAERNGNASRYSKYVERERKANAKEKRIAIIGFIGLYLFFMLVLVDAFGLYPAQASATETAMEMEQEYVVRYGNIDGYLDNGDMIIVTEDGNEWILQDAPCYPNGTELRILFASNLTTIATDDEIIDITER